MITQIDINQMLLEETRKLNERFIKEAIEQWDRLEFDRPVAFPFYIFQDNSERWEQLKWN